MSRTLSEHLKDLEMSSLNFDVLFVHEREEARFEFSVMAMDFENIDMALVAEAALSALEDSILLGNNGDFFDSVSYEDIETGFSKGEFNYFSEKVRFECAMTFENISQRDGE